MTMALKNILAFLAASASSLAQTTAAEIHINAVPSVMNKFIN